MLSFIFIICTAGEWIGELSIPQIGLTLFNLTRIDKEEHFGMKGYLCLDKDCRSPAILLHYNQTISKIYKKIAQISPKASIVVSNIPVAWVFSTPGFILPEENYLQILQHVTSSTSIIGELTYRYECNYYIDHCDKSLTISRFYLYLLLSWFILLLLWIWNTCAVNSRYSVYFHKVSSVIIVFKTISVLTSLWYWNNCPYNTSAAQLVRLLRAQCQALFETSWLCYHLFISQGVYLLQDSLTRPAISYSMSIMIILYILACGSNLLESHLRIMSLIMNIIVFLHTLYFSSKTFQKLTIQRRNAHYSGHHLLISTVAKRFLIFTFIFVIQSLYFAGNMILIITNSQQLYNNIYKEINIENEKIISSEIGEGLIIIIIFFIVRSRPVDPFFFSEIDFEIHRIIPFYHGDSQHFANGIAIVKAPGKIMIAVPKG